MSVTAIRAPSRSARTSRTATAGTTAAHTAVTVPTAMTAARTATTAVRHVHAAAAVTDQRSCNIKKRFCSERLSFQTEPFLYFNDEISV